MSASIAGLFMTMIDLRLGDWRDVLATIECDALITDPPYDARTHDATNKYVSASTLPDGASRASIGYEAMTPGGMRDMIDVLAHRVRGWIAIMTSHTLAQSALDAMARHRRYVFAPIPIIQPRPRLMGDGPASWTVWLCVSRPRTMEYREWGCLPGAYLSSTDRTGIVTGAKPLSLMRAIVRDYSRPGELVCDPFAGGATTLIAAASEGRRAIGAEANRDTHEAALRRIKAGIELPLPFAADAETASNTSLFTDDGGAT